EETLPTIRKKCSACSLLIVCLSLSDFVNAASCIWSKTVPTTGIFSGTGTDPKVSFSSGTTKGCYDTNSNIPVNYKTKIYYGYIIPSGISYSYIGNGRSRIVLRDYVTLEFTSKPYKSSTIIDGPGKWGAQPYGSGYEAGSWSMNSADLNTFFQEIKVSVNSDSMTAGAISIPPTVIMKAYLGGTNTSSIPDGGIIPSYMQPTFEVTASGTITFTNACNITPSNVEINFGDITTGMLKKQPSKKIDLTVSCNTNLNLDAYINGIKDKKVSITTSNSSVNASLEVTQNDFKLNAVKNGVVSINAILFPTDTDVKPGILQGVAYLDMRLE
ncbi:TPA: hypothetical protein ACIBVV_004613, partial [Salmonella enterica subsp. enterica serovar Potsdam]